ncbi:hypothetical protein [Haladaptatus salinisoli]|uniref:hypothetical protein n=1 Tax=Haladaptatus salinisoli TaxID=2884876 RepID=UPI001D0BE545|nr:hypothetical protein [Haladaptatus salinisoli]
MRRELSDLFGDHHGKRGGVVAALKLDGYHGCRRGGANDLFEGRSRGKYRLSLLIDRRFDTVGGGFLLILVVSGLALFLPILETIQENIDGIN